MKKLFPFLMCVTFINLYAQQNIIRCAFDEANNIQSERNLNYKKAITESFNYAKVIAQHNAYKRNSDSVLRIPVVVHIVYKTTQQNIPDSLVYSQIEILNRDFRRQNSDTATLRSIFDGLGKDSGIEFYLAFEDPDGNPTTGITRTQTTRDAFTFSLFGGGGLDDVKFDSLQGKNSWNTNEYLNIWVCNTVDPQSFFGAVLGYAYPPQGAPNWPVDAFPADPRVEGVVIHFEVFGSPNPYAVGDFAVANKGRTAVHEIGHYLGLRHIWGDGQAAIFGGTDCTVDDGIADTPNSGNNSQAGCNANKNTCNDGPGDLPDMWENYMDYSEESCQTIFTEGQVDIMRAMLQTARSGLLQGKCIDTTNVGVKESITTLAVNIYPNPSSGIINIDFGTVTNNVKVSITNTIGNVVSEFVFNNNQSQYAINTNNFSKGIYFMHIKSGDRTAIKRIVINE